MQNKLKQIEEILKEMDSVLIAYSGGVDSTLLLYLASKNCSKVFTVIASSETYPEKELGKAKINVANFGIDYTIIETNELSNPKFVENSPDRCYFCKKELFLRLKNIAIERGLGYILDGTNLDDMLDTRPGIKAAQEFGVRSPLKEAGFTKNEIRALSKKLGFSTWNKPSFACLASRLPYGEKITEEKLKKIEKAEEFLANLIQTQIRVRSHNNIARIEIEQGEMANALSLSAKITKKFKELGFTYVTLDLEGYRTGSMNVGLESGIGSRES